MNFVTKLVVTFFLFAGILHIHTFLTPHVLRAQSNELQTVAVFLREGCAHCAEEEEFLDELVKERQDIQVDKYHLENAEDKKVWDAFTSNNQLSKVTPITIVGNYYIVGFENKETTGKKVIELLERPENSNVRTDIFGNQMIPMEIESDSCFEDPSLPCTNSEESYTVTVPIIGSINSSKYPLFILSALLGFFDGFNPCAMWVLVMFLTILLQVGDKKKMLLFAGTFILAESVMYLLILTVWYKTWDFVQLDTVVTPIVGLVAIGGGIFFLREWRKKELECKVTNLQTRQKTVARIKSLATSKFTLFTFLGILGIAFSVNIIEFACSIGIPQAFTKILEINQLSFLHSFIYIIIYIIFYMVDDFIVFGIALYGFNKMHLTTKYSKLSNLIGGIVMIILGTILILKPSLLLF